MAHVGERKEERREGEETDAGNFKGKVVLKEIRAMFLTLVFILFFSSDICWILHVVGLAHMLAFFGVIFEHLFYDRYCAMC